MYRVDIGCVTELGFELVGESSSGDELWSQRLQTLKISSGECAKRKTESASMESDIRPQWKTFLWNHRPVSQWRVLLASVLWPMGDG